MNYNELKLLLLSLLDPKSEYDFQEIRHLLYKHGLGEKGKAVEMALMRYSRQGLLSRKRAGRRFRYRLTERGIARRNWLAGQRKSED